MTLTYFEMAADVVNSIIFSRRWTKENFPIPFLNGYG